MSEWLLDTGLGERGPAQSTYVTQGINDTWGIREEAQLPQGESWDASGTGLGQREVYNYTKSR